MNIYRMIEISLPLALIACGGESPIQTSIVQPAPSTSVTIPAEDAGTLDPVDATPAPDALTVTADASTPDADDGAAAAQAACEAQFCAADQTLCGVVPGYGGGPCNGVNIDCGDHCLAQQLQSACGGNGEPNHCANNCWSDDGSACGAHGQYSWSSQDSSNCKGNLFKFVLNAQAQQVIEVRDGGFAGCTDYTLNGITCCP